MIDFVKVLVEGFDGKRLKRKHGLSFQTVVDEVTGETKNSSEAFYKGMKIIVINNGTTLLKGSLHYYYNNGNHNYNDFTYSRLKSTLKELETEFGFDLDRCKLQNLEVGLNINPGLETSVLLDRLVLHKMEKFKDISLRSGNYKQVTHTAFFLKAYDKALQNSIYDRRIFRWEVKMMRSEIINKHGVVSLQDLINKQLLYKLLEDMISRWNEILLLDPTIRFDELTGNDMNQMNSWKYKEYWLNLRAKNCGGNRHYYTKELKKYKQLVKHHSDNTHNSIYNRLIEKSNYCLNN